MEKYSNMEMNENWKWMKNENWKTPLPSPPTGHLQKKKKKKTGPVRPPSGHGARRSVNGRWTGWGGGKRTHFFDKHDLSGNATGGHIPTRPALPALAKGRSAGHFASCGKSRRAAAGVMGPERCWHDGWRTTVLTLYPCQTTSEILLATMGSWLDHP